MLFKWKPKFCKPEQRKDTSYNLRIGEKTFSYELMFWCISSENSGKQESKNTLGIEINQFGDG